jgi:hypothetical protein
MRHKNRPRVFSPGLKNAEYISFGGKNAPEAKTQLKILISSQSDLHVQRDVASQAVSLCFYVSGVNGAIGNQGWLNAVALIGAVDLRARPGRSRQGWRPCAGIAALRDICGQVIAK